MGLMPVDVATWQGFAFINPSKSRCTTVKPAGEKTQLPCTSVYQDSRLAAISSWIKLRPQNCSCCLRLALSRIAQLVGVFDKTSTGPHRTLSLQARFREPDVPTGNGI